MTETNEGYQPSEQEIKQAEEIMNPEQRRLSDEREKIADLKEIGKEEFERRIEALSSKIIDVALKLREQNLDNLSKVLENDSVDPFDKSDVKKYIPEAQKTYQKIDQAKNQEEKFSSIEIRPYISLEYPRAVLSAGPESKSDKIVIASGIWDGEYGVGEQLNSEDNKMLELITFINEFNNKIAGYQDIKKQIDMAGLDPENPDIFETK